MKNWKERLVEYAKSEHDKLARESDVTDLTLSIDDQGLPNVRFKRNGVESALLLTGYQAFK